MVYEKVVSILMIIIEIIIFIFPLEHLLICLVSLFAKPNKFKTQTEKLKYGVIICARNEERVISGLINSIKNAKYEQNKLQIFVIAHNCTDKTAEKARESGAIVYEYSNPNERTKGFALKKIFEFINEDYGIQNFDGYHVFDADNIVDSEYFEKMNDAFLNYDKKYAITSFRNSKNFGHNNQTANYGIMYIICSTLESNGRMKINGTARILGSGFLVSNEMVKNGWNITIPSDDTDFTIEQTLEGKNVKYCHDAMYYDEHPTKFKDMWRQRLRWAVGSRLVCRKRFKSLMANIFSFKKRQDGQKRLRFNSLDLLFAILPVGFIGTLATLIHIFLISLAPLFGAESIKMWTGWAILFSISLMIFYVWLYIIGIICYIKERKRIKGVSRWRKITSLFLWPFFGMLLIPIQIVAMFKNIKKFTWTQIDHVNNEIT